MLSRMRDERTGKPTVSLRVLGVVVALLLAGPLTVAVVRGASAIVDALY
jgi:hypothetical protein